MSEQEMAQAIRRQDEEARLRALDVGSSILLRAPAGSGKTTVLTARFLTLLAQAEEPEEILAVTFTRKATAEMRRRVLEAIEAGTQVPPRAVSGISPELLQRAARHAQERGWQLERNPARLQIKTIDALSAWLARLLPVSARAGGALQVVEEAGDLYLRAARRTVNTALREDGGFDVRQVCEHLENDITAFEQLLVNLLETRQQWLPYLLGGDADQLLALVQESIGRLLETSFRDALAEFPQVLLREGEELLLAADANLGRERVGEAARLGPGLGSAQRWRDLCELLLNKSGKWRRKFDKNNGFPPKPAELKERMQSWAAQWQQYDWIEVRLAQLAHLPGVRLSDSEQSLLRALGPLLLHAAAELQMLFAEVGAVDFPYLNGAAIQALSDTQLSDDAAQRVTDRVRHILVDEFQDTSGVQLTLLLLLTREWRPGDGRTLFLVGDPVQSIYRFRGAEVALFLDVARQGMGHVPLTVLDLRRNFRSEPPIVDWVNELFRRVLPAANPRHPDVVSYLESVASTAAAPSDSAVLFHRIPAPLPDVPDAEAAAALQIVQAVRSSQPAASIAILVSAREHAATIVAQLRSASVPVRGVRLEALRNSEVVRDLCNLARALVHAGDDVAWLGLLRAPWCGLELAELLWLRDVAPDSVSEFVLFAKEPDLAAAPGVHTAQRLRRLRQALLPAIDGEERGWPLWQRLEQCWLRLAGPAIWAGAGAASDVDAFITLLAGKPDAEDHVGDDFDVLLEGLYSDTPSPAGAVEVMTIHGAKGLEWDVVLLPGLQRKSRGEDRQLIEWLSWTEADGHRGLLVAPLTGRNSDDGSGTREYIRHVSGAHIESEKIRQLYVACTRARRQLHLLAQIPADGEEPDKRSALAVLWPVVESDFRAVAPEASSPTPTQLPPVPLLRRLPADWLPSSELPAPPPGVLRQPPPVERDQPEYSWVGMTARAIGTIVHAELQRLAAAGSVHRAAAYEPWLAELGVAQSERARAARRIVEALEAVLQDPTGRWLLSNNHSEAASEMRLSGLMNGELLNIIIDRMLVDDKGVRWVIDYKTSTHEGAGLEQFLLSEEQRYAGQMQRYARLASQLGPQPVRAALYFPLLAQMRVVALNGVDAS